MRVLFGLAALAASVVQGQVVSLSGSAQGVGADAAIIGSTALARINVFQTALNGVVPTISPTGQVGNGNFINSNNFALSIPNAIFVLVFEFNTNQYTAQLQHRWSPGYTSPAITYPGLSLSAQSYTCDICAGSTPISCNTATGPGSSPSPATGFPCALFQRVYTFQGLAASSSAIGSSPTVNYFAVQLFDRIPNTSSYSFSIIRQAPPIVGDPQIYGLQGQDFQVHGIPDEIFNMISYPTLQVNARFVYLSEGECHDNFTACFAHPGTYISEEGIRLGSDKVHVVAGSFKKGLTVSVNGKKITCKSTALKLGGIELLSHRRVVIKTPIMSLSISNSDHFLNQESQLFDDKLLELGSKRRILADEETFHSEVPLHGLQGQTWRNVEYPSGLEYEGTINDYHIASGNLYGSDFVFNQYEN